MGQTQQRDSQALNNVYSSFQNIVKLVELFSFFTKTCKCLYLFEWSSCSCNEQYLQRALPSSSARLDISFRPNSEKAKLFKIDQGEVKEVIVSISSSFISQHRMVNVFHESQSFLVSVDQRQRVFLRMDG